ncbi:hypothetical protein CH06BL_31150 [Chromobacterium haemolyticum]|nr:hypothetical protein CH06BL_31150 [Chromobacterium haemolyticum]
MPLVLEEAACSLTTPFRERQSRDFLGKISFFLFQAIGVMEIEYSKKNNLPPVLA